MEKIRATDVELHNNFNTNLFKKEKFKQILHFIIHECASRENIGKTVIYKILYFLDFDYYELYEELLTGESYRKLQFGPAPDHFEEVIKELEGEKKIVKFPRTYGEYTQKRFLSFKEPDISLLSGIELQMIENEIARFSNMSATQISAFCHGDMPYKATEDNDIIDYELVFYRDPLFSVREYDED